MGEAYDTLTARVHELDDIGQIGGLLVAFVLLVAIIVIGLWQWNSIRDVNRRIEIGDEAILVSAAHRKEVIIDAPPGSTYVPYVPAKLEPIPGVLQPMQNPSENQNPK